MSQLALHGALRSGLDHLSCACVFAPGDGALLAGSSCQPKVALVDANSGAVRLLAVPGGANCLAVAGDGGGGAQRAACACDDGTVRLLDCRAPGWAPDAIALGAGPPCGDVALHGHALAVARGAAVEVRDGRKSFRVAYRSVDLHAEGVYALHMPAEGRLWSGGDDGLVCEHLTGRAAPGEEDAVEGCVYSVQQPVRLLRAGDPGADEVFAVTTVDTLVHCRTDRATGGVTQRTAAHPLPGAYAVGWARGDDPLALVWGDGDGRVRLAHGASEWAGGAHADVVRFAAPFDAAGERLGTVGQDGTVAVWGRGQAAAAGAKRERAE